MSNSISDPGSEPTSREKWDAERHFRSREVDLKEREVEIKEKEVDIRDKELDIRRKEQEASGWRSPLVVAILAATVAAAGNAAITVVNGRLQRELENQKSEQLRILEMIKTGDADKAAENLEFLVSTGLITDSIQKKAIRTYLGTREPGDGPALPAETPVVSRERRGIIGSDEAVAVDSLPANHRIRTAAQANGRLLATDSSGVESPRCNAFLVADSLALTSQFCLHGAIAMRLVIGGREGEKSYPVDLPPVEMFPNTAARTDLSGESVNYALLRVRGNAASGSAGLRLATTAPTPGQQGAVIMYRGQSAEQLAVVNSVECQVIVVFSAGFSHQCDAGIGTAGAPILSADGSQVLGIHFAGGPNQGMAIRADVLVQMSRRLRDLQ